MSDRIQELLRRAHQERAAGQPSQAESHYEAAADLARSEGDDVLLAHALRHISDLAREAGNPTRAVAAGREALAIYRSRSDSPQLDVANALRVTALARKDAGDPNGSASCWREARSLYEEAAVMAGVEDCDANLSLLDPEDRTPRLR